MTAQQARFAKHSKALARLYCHRDGTKPEPEVPIHLVYRNMYKGVKRSFFPMRHPVLAQIKAMPSSSSLQWSGNAAYFDVEVQP